MTLSVGDGIEHRGLGLLSKPYAFQQGGIISILWLALIVFIMNYSERR